MLTLEVTFASQGLQSERLNIQNRIRIDVGRCTGAVVAACGSRLGAEGHPVTFSQVLLAMIPRISATLFSDAILAFLSNVLHARNNQHVLKVLNVHLLFKRVGEALVGRT